MFVMPREITRPQEDLQLENRDIAVSQPQNPGSIGKQPDTGTWLKLMDQNVEISLGICLRFLEELVAV